MLRLDEYVKDKTDKLIVAFFELYEKAQEEWRGREIKHVSRFQTIDIDEEYSLRVDWSWKWEIVYNESKAIICETTCIGSYALSELIGTFTENVIDDYHMIYQ